MSGRTGKWGKPEWQKAQYKTGKLIFYNTTWMDDQWTANGQDITLKLTQGGRTKQITIKPGTSWEFQPEDGSLSLKAKPQLSTMKSGTVEIKKPQTFDNHHIWIKAGPGTKFGLQLLERSSAPPAH